MRRSNFLLFGLLIGAGCAPKPEAVSVDLDAVLASEPVSRPAIPTVPQAPSPRPSRTVTLPGLKPQTLSDPSVGMVSAAQGVEEAQQLALKTLTRRLAAFYQRESERFANDERKRLGDPYRAAFETEYPAIRARFDRYAEKRSPLFARLAFVAGFPDPNPDNKPVPKAANLLVQKQLDEAHTLRIQLRSVDEAYREDVLTLMAHAEGMAKVQMVELEKRISAYMDQMQERARDEAESEVRAKPSELGLRLAAPQRLSVPGTPDRKVSIAGEEAMPPPPKVQSGGVLGDTAEERKLLMRRQLKIWLALKRYTLATPQAPARDATREFMTWRKEQQAGL